MKLASLDEDRNRYTAMVDRWSEIEGFEARAMKCTIEYSLARVSKGLAEDVFDNLGPVVASTFK